jgi:hypothetical protein
VIVPPMLCVTRAELETAGTPEGGVALSVAVPVPEVFAMGTRTVAAVPLLSAAKFTAVGLAGDALNDCVAPPGTGDGVGVGFTPPPPPGGIDPPPPPPPQAASASATEKSKGRPTRRWIMYIAFIL